METEEPSPGGVVAPSSGAGLVPALWPPLSSQAVDCAACRGRHVAHICGRQKRSTVVNGGGGGGGGSAVAASAAGGEGSGSSETAAETAAAPGEVPGCPGRSLRAAGKLPPRLRAKKAIAMRSVARIYVGRRCTGASAELGGSSELPWAELSPRYVAAVQRAATAPSEAEVLGYRQRLGLGPLPPPPPPPHYHGVSSSQPMWQQEQAAAAAGPPLSSQAVDCAACRGRHVAHICGRQKRSTVVNGGGGGGGAGSGEGISSAPPPSSVGLQLPADPWARGLLSLTLLPGWRTGMGTEAIQSWHHHSTYPELPPPPPPGRSVLDAGVTIDAAALQDAIRAVEIQHGDQPSRAPPWPQDYLYGVHGARRGEGGGAAGLGQRGPSLQPGKAEPSRSPLGVTQSNGRGACEPPPPPPPPPQPGPPRISLMAGPSGASALSSLLNPHCSGEAEPVAIDPDGPPPPREGDSQSRERTETVTTGAETAASCERQAEVQWLGEGSTTQSAEQVDVSCFT
jgi:hypothetical protein